MDDSGVGREFIRSLRTFWPGFFHSDRQILKWSKAEAAAARELLGEPIKIKNGYMLPLERTCIALFHWALTETCHPAALNEEEESMENLLSVATQSIEKRIDGKRKKLQEIVIDVDAEPNADANGVTEARHPLQPTPTEQKAKLEHRISQLEKEKANLVVKKEKADRNGMTPNASAFGVGMLNILSKKENCLGKKLLYRQVCRGVGEAIHILMKACFDGRNILRHMTKDKKCQQAALCIKPLDTGSSISARSNTFAVGVVDHGENGGDELMSAFAALVKTHRDNGVILDYPVLIPDKSGIGPPQLVTGVFLQPDWCIVPDGAYAFKCCDGPCGPSSHTPCHCCDVIRDNDNIKYNSGMAFEWYTVKGGDTPKSIAEAHHMDYELLCLYNPDHSTEAGALQEEAWTELTIKSKGSTDFSTAKAKVDVSSFGANEVFSINRRTRKKQVRVRLLWPMTRKLKPIFADVGITWEDFGMCTTHADMRMLEWAVYNLVRDSDFSQSVVNDWLLENGCKVQYDCEDSKFQKASFNARSAQCDLWFQKINYKGREMLRYEAACLFFDPVTIDGVVVPNPSTINVWKTLEPLRELYLLLYPSPKQQAMIGPLTLQHFVAFRLRYKDPYVHHYLHQLFAHATPIMKKFKSLGLLRNESEEGINSEDKQWIESHSLRGGAGSDMCFDLVDHYARKVYRKVKDIFSLDLSLPTWVWGSNPQ